MRRKTIGGKVAKVARWQGGKVARWQGGKVASKTIGGKMARKTIGGKVARCQGRNRW